MPDQYAVVGSVTSSPGAAVITLAQSPSLLRLVSGGVQCGIHDLGEGMALSVVDLVHYDLRSMVLKPNYAALFKASGLGTGGTAGAVPYESGRAELVRVELNSQGQEVAATRELVAEYAVDLQLSAWGAANAQTPTLTAVTASVINDTYASTELLRGVHVRFSTRSREADRDADVSGVGGPGDVYRIPLGPAKGAPFAREGATRGASPSPLAKCGGQGASTCPSASWRAASSSRRSRVPGKASIAAWASPFAA